jgi:hypothetical protein
LRNNYPREVELDTEKMPPSCPGPLRHPLGPLEEASERVQAACVDNHFFFIHPLGKHLLSDCYISDIALGVDGITVRRIRLVSSPRTDTIKTAVVVGNCESSLSILLREGGAVYLGIRALQEKWKMPRCGPFQELP